MRKTLTVTAALWVAVFISSSAVEAAPCAGDITRIRADAEALVALGPRPDSSPQAAAAIDHIEVVLGTIGLFPNARRIETIAFAPGTTLEYEPSFILRGLKALEIDIVRMEA